MSAPPVASAGVVPTDGDSGVNISANSATNAGVSSNNALETAAHTSALNVLDPYFYEHFIRFASFTWSTSNMAGTTLYSLDLTPYTMWYNLAHVMQMYNTWAGGFELRIEIAGTGFTGGKIMMVRVPPNIDSSLYSINDYTMLSYVMLDPKSQTSTVLDIDDYRQGMFHFANNYNDTELGKVQNSIGTLKIIVMMPLIVTSAVSTNVNIQVSGRLKPGFVVGQMVPANVSQEQPSFSRDFSKILSRAHTVPDIAGLKLNTLTLTTLSSVAYAGVDSLVKWDRNYYGTNSLYIPDPQAVEMYYDSVNTTGSGTTYPANYVRRMKITFANATNPELAWEQGGVVERTQVNDIDYSNDLLAWTTAAAPSLGAPRQYISRELPYRYVFDTPSNITGPSVALTLDTETLVMFKNLASSALGTLTTQEFIDFIVDNELDNFPTDTTIVFLVVAGTTDDPLFYLRWWPEGYFTTNKRTADVNIDITLSNLRLVFHSFLSKYSSLPTVPNITALNKNLQLHSLALRLNLL